MSTGTVRQTRGHGAAVAYKRLLTIDKLSGLSLWRSYHTVGPVFVCRI